MVGSYQQAKKLVSENNRYVMCSYSMALFARVVNSMNEVCRYRGYGQQFVHTEALDKADL